MFDRNIFSGGPKMMFKIPLPIADVWRFYNFLFRFRFSYVSTFSSKNSTIISIVANSDLVGSVNFDQSEFIKNIRSGSWIP